MRFSQEQIQKGIVVVFQSRSEIVHNAKEAEDIIPQLSQCLSVNDWAKKYLANLFAGEEVEYGLKTTGCGVNPIRFYPALAETIEEHNRIYKEKCEAEKAERIKAAHEANEKLWAEFNVQRKGWYRVSVSLTALHRNTSRRHYLDSSGIGRADSKFDAYNKFVSTIQHPDLDKRNLILEECSPWNGRDTEVDFLGETPDAASF